MVGLPLLVIAFSALVAILAHSQDVLQPLFIAVFCSYLIRPLVNCLTAPVGECASLACCLPMCRFFCRRCSRDKPITKDEQDDDFEDLGLLTSKRVTPTPQRRGIGRHRCPHWLAVMVAFCMVLGSIVGAFVIVINSVTKFEHESLHLYEKQAAITRDDFLNWLQSSFKVDGKDLMTKLGNDIAVSKIFTVAFTAIYNTLTGFFVVFLFILYLLLEKTEQNYSKESMRTKIDTQIQRYILLKTLISAAVAGLVYIIIGPVLGVRLSSLWGVLTFVLNFIPNVGPIIATILPAPVIIFDPSFNTAHMILALALPGSVHALVGNLIEPKIFGNHLDLHPIFLLLSLSFWFAIWGMSGAILCVPIMAVLRIIISHSRHPYAMAVINLMEGNLHPLMAKGNPNNYMRDR